MSDKVRVAIIGVGNCASSFIQGVQYYRNAKADEFVPGLMHVNLGGYHISDIEFTCAFDIDKTKVGKDLSQAIWGGRNCTVKFSDVPEMGVKVYRGMTHDGLGKYLSEVIEKAPGPTDDVVGILKRHQDRRGGELPARGQRDGHQVVRGADPRGRLRASSTASRSSSPGRSTGRSASRSGACRSSATTSSRRWAPPSSTGCSPGSCASAACGWSAPRQLNVGGNTDFLNMLERERLESKKISKTNSVTSQLDYDMGSKNIHIGPSDYVEWLDDRKWAYIRMEGRTFGDVPLNIELKLEVVDSPNSAGIVIDAVRCAKLALDRGISGRAVRAVFVLHEVAARSSTATTRPGARPRPSSRTWASKPWRFLRTSKPGRDRSAAAGGDPREQVP